MIEDCIEEFLTGFDESRFPQDFLETYELMECLADNTISETLIVKDRQSGVHYVAKCYSDKSLLSRTSESELLKKLDHPGLPAFIAEYENEKMHCVVRTFARGKSLDKLIRETPLTSQQAITVATQLCDILTYLHGQTPPIIHRDIKPQNIIVGDFGKITLIDFGSSRIFDETSEGDTCCVGTRYFAAPEQYGFAQTDRRTDIYSLGVLIYWMLTGKVDVQQAKKTVENRLLQKTIAKCTAFEPDHRYQNAAQVKDALTGRTARRRTLLLAGAALVILIASFHLIIMRSGGIPDLFSSEMTFEEPLIEEAVRATLGKDAAEPISEEDLLSIRELFIFGDNVATNTEVFQQYADRFVNNGGGIRRGSIRSLDDLKKLKNLSRISLVFQNIADINGLAELTYLEYIDLRHNPLEDVSPLSHATSLDTLILFDTNVADLTSLSGCHHLVNVDIGDTQVQSITALDGLDSLKNLSTCKAPLHSLEGIETHPMLEKIYLSETQILDLSPLLNLPRLQSIEISENMRSAAEGMGDKAQFDIAYQ